MKALPDVLRDADPLGYEPRRSDQQRRRILQGMLDAADGDRNRPHRRFVLAAAAGLTLAGITAGSRYWSSVAVDLVAAVRFEARLAEEAAADGLREVVISADRTIYLHPETVVTNSDIAQARVVPGEAASAFNVAITFNADGAAKMFRATQGHLGRPLAILLDGKVVMAPVVRSAIRTAATISGDYSQADAERIVAGIIGR